jgi:hypothetical protein
LCERATGPAFLSNWLTSLVLAGSVVFKEREAMESMDVLALGLTVGVLIYHAVKN